MDRCTLDKQHGGNDDAIIRSMIEYGFFVESATGKENFSVNNELLSS